MTITFSSKSPTLTTADAAALRRADSICFDTDPEGGAIRAIFRATDREAERTITIPVASTSVQNYGPGDGPWKCFAMTMSAQYDDVTRTLVRHLKRGSAVALRWTRGNSSPVTEQAGLVVDHLDVRVANGTVADTFRVATYIGHDNTARMVRSI